VGDGGRLGQEHGPQAAPVVPQIVERIGARAQDLDELPDGEFRRRLANELERRHGDAPRQGPTHSEDALKCKNVSTIALEVDISTLQKDHKSLSKAANILDPDYVIGVWASASRQRIRTLNGNGTESNFGAWVQVYKAWNAIN